MSAFFKLCLTFVLITVGESISRLSLKENFQTKPFVSIWNTPSLKCERNFGVHFNLSYFDIVANSGDYFEGDEVVIFYKNILGLYPWIDGNEKFINGGLPQLANLSSHVHQLIKDLDYYIPNASFSGLAVIDWESWRPIFDRNGYNDVMKVYIRESENIVRDAHPDWPEEKIETEARQEFEIAARKFMQTTLQVCRQQRPFGFWGFYGFPSCYNYGRGQRTCGSDTIQYNDELWWLFNTSSTLLPSIYLSEDMGSHVDRFDRVYGGLKETLRVKSKYGEPFKTLVSYTRFRYGDTGNFYDTTDLQNTIGQTAEVGYNGVALWDSSFSFESQKQCENVRDYIDSILGPFVKSLSEKVNNCSQKFCSGHGRCVVNDVTLPSNDNDFSVFHFLKALYRKLCQKVVGFIEGNTFFEYSSIKNNTNFYIKNDFEIRYRTKNQQTFPELLIPRKGLSNFHCVCFKGWTGNSCEKAYTQETPWHSITNKS